MGKSKEGERWVKGPRWGTGGSMVNEKREGTSKRKGEGNEEGIEGKAEGWDTAMVGSEVPISMKQEE